MTFEELVAAFGELKAQNDTVIRALREERDRSKHERDEYKKYELVLLELERTRRHLFGKKAETVDTAQTQLAFQHEARILIAEPQSLPIERGLAGPGLGGRAANHVYQGEHLPLHHRDPFDQLLAAQASHEGMRLVSRDPKLDAYPATRVWDRVYEKVP